MEHQPAASKLTCLHFSPPHEPYMREPHSHNDVELNFIESGSLTYLFGGSQSTLEPGRLYVFWATVPHQVVRMEAVHYFVIHLPLAQFLKWQLPDAFARKILGGDVLTAPHDDESAFNMALFQRWHRHLQTQNQDYQKITMLEIEACLRCLALSSQAPAQLPSDLPPQNGFERVQKMATFMAENYRESLTVTQISRAADVHPNYAMQLFRQHANMTIIDYLTQYRVAQAQHLLLTTEQKVIEIAFETGFGSLSRFYAIFKQVCNTSPTQYRRALRQSDSVAKAPSPLFTQLS